MIAIMFFVFGLAFGSFALAMVDRMKDGRDWVKGRSECEYCKTQLKTVDLVPVFSWLFRAGKCAYCKKRLSSAYPLTELLSGVFFLVSYLNLPHTSLIDIVRLAIWLLACVILTALIVFDIRWFLLPNKLIFPLIFLSFADVIFRLTQSSESIFRNLLWIALSLAISWAIFLVLYTASHGKWLGDGDVRLGAAIGLFLASPVLSWLCIFLASVFGIVYYLLSKPLRLTKSKKSLNQFQATVIPFGPSLILALFVVKIFGQSMIDQYINFFVN
jgi:prepilin signal peptidase PulO-like enzyme (type II secretory pathway)